MTTRRVPAAVRVAAGLLALYGLSVLVRALLAQSAIGWSADELDLWPAVLRFLMAAVIAGGLLSGDRWAWWLGLLLPGFWAAAGAFALVVLWTAEPETRGLVAPAGLAFALASTPALTATVVLLLQPASRRAFSG